MSLLVREIEAAHERIAPHILRTPLVLSQPLSEKLGAQIHLKNEHLQHTGSFKLRGALNKILSLGPEHKKRGVIAASTGNHGLGIAYAARLAQVEATVYVSKTASPPKLKGITSLGARLVLVEGDCLVAELQARQKAEENGQTFISPYNDATVIAGQGTIGLELHQQLRDLDSVFVSVGGGGLISGIAAYLKRMNPEISIVGCWPENAPVMYEAMKKGEIFPVEERPTLSDATAGGLEPGSITLPLCQQFIDEKILVSEQEIKRALLDIAETEHWMVEGSAAVALAALTQKKNRFRDQKVAIVLCGRNIELRKFTEVISCKSSPGM